MRRIIVACDEDNGIGLEGGLPWRIKGELAHFKAMTMGDNVLVGRVTYEGMPMLDGRNVYVMSRDSSLVLRNGGTRISCLNDVPEDCWIAGGESIYYELLAADMVDEVHLSRIDGSWGCDKFFPGFNDGRFSLRDITHHDGWSYFKYT
jgi:dihydrofolate reductase